MTRQTVKFASRTNRSYRTLKPTDASFTRENIQRGGRVYADLPLLLGFDEENVTAAGGFRVRETMQ